MRHSIAGFALALALAGQAAAQAPAAADPMAAMTGFTDAVNRNDMAGALTYLGPSPSIVDDLAPYRWQGPGAGGAWMAAMGANAQARGMTTINMKLGKASRVPPGRGGVPCNRPGSPACHHRSPRATATRQARAGRDVPGRYTRCLPGPGAGQIS